MNMILTNNLKKIQNKLPLIIVRTYCSSRGLNNRPTDRSRSSSVSRCGCLPLPLPLGPLGIECCSTGLGCIQSTFCDSIGFLRSQFRLDYYQCPDGKKLLPSEQRALTKKNAEIKKAKEDAVKAKEAKDKLIKDTQSQLANTQTKLTETIKKLEESER